MAPAPPAPNVPGIDMRQILAMLSQTSQRALQGQMPGPEFAQGLNQFTQGAVARARQAAAVAPVAPAPRAPRTPPPAGAAPVPGGGWGGSEKPIRQLAKLATPFGLTVTSEKRTSPSPVAGTRSDHYVGNKTAYANDIGWGGQRPTAQSDRAASAIVSALGGPANWGRHGGNWRTVVNGVRYQVIYRSNVGGNHWNHIHVGARVG